MKRNLFLFLLMAGGFAITFNSCKKETPDTETQSSVDNSIAEGEFTKSISNINTYAIKQPGIKTMEDYDHIFIDSITNAATGGWPRFIHIYYGPNPTVTTEANSTIGLDGRRRWGNIVIKLNHHWMTLSPGQIDSAEISLDTFHVENLKLEAQKILLTRTNTNSFTCYIENAKCTSLTGNWVIKWGCTRTFTRSFVNGQTRLTISGQADGYSRKNLHYTANIDKNNPLIKDSTCHYMSAGQFTLQPDGLAARTINYGNGTCDSLASLTINGNTYQFTIN